MQVDVKSLTSTYDKSTAMLEAFNTLSVNS